MPHSISAVSAFRSVRDEPNADEVILVPTLRPTNPPTATLIPTAIPTAIPPSATPIPATPVPTTPTPIPTFTAVFAPTPIPTAITAPTIAPTSGPYAGLTINDLVVRQYGAGELKIGKTLGTNAVFTRKLFTYESDGLTIYGFINIPHETAEKPLPIIIVCHGHVDPAYYQTEAYTTGQADALARAGYIVLHPNFRNFPPSDYGPNEMRIGYAIDVLNLTALVRKQAGNPGPFKLVDPYQMGLWGHSMGGGIVLRTLVVDHYIKAALLYASMSGDELLNHEKLVEFSGPWNGNWDPGERPSDADLRQISPINHLWRINAAVSIHHGTLDPLPLEWATDLCADLQELGKVVECFTYYNAAHFFDGDDKMVFDHRTTRFFDQYLK